METKFAVALLKGDEDKILGIFSTKEEADHFGKNNIIDMKNGLQYCFSSLFIGNTPVGNSMRIYDYYNISTVYEAEAV